MSDRKVYEKFILTLAIAPLALLGGFAVFTACEPVAARRGPLAATQALRLHPEVMSIPACDGDSYLATIDNIVDADTFDLDVRLPYVPLGLNITQRVRLAHVDAPERFTEAGKAATAFVYKWAERNEVVRYMDMGPDKYGRRVAVIIGWETGEVLAEQLVFAGHAKPYMPHVTAPEDSK